MVHLGHIDGAFTTYLQCCDEKNCILTPVIPPPLVCNPNSTDFQSTSSQNRRIRRLFFDSDQLT